MLLLPRESIYSLLFLKTLDSRLVEGLGSAEG